MSHCCPYVGEGVHKRYHSVDHISPSAVKMLGLVGQYCNGNEFVSFSVR